MAIRTREASGQLANARERHETPLSSYFGLAIIAGIMLVMIVLQHAGAQGLVE